MFHSFAFYAVLMQRQFREYCQKELRDAGLSSGLLFFILYIGKHPGCNVKSLITALKLDSGHATLSLNLNKIILFNKILIPMINVHEFCI